MIKTAVVILNWNGILWLQKFLENVDRLTSSGETAVYLADNGSTDGSADWVEEKLSKVRVIRLEKNFGFAGGYNRVLKEIDAKYYVLLNSDVEVTEGWLSPLINFMDENPDVASCQPKIKSYYKRNCFEYGGAAGGFIDRFGYTFCRGRIFDRIEEDFGQYDEPSDIFWSTGACMVVRSKAWKLCGGLDDDFFAHMEEVDLCWRFHNSGFRVSCIPESVVYHAGGGSLPYESKFKTYLNFRNNLFLLYKNLPEKKLHRVILIRRILDGVAALYFSLKGRPGVIKSVWKAHVDFYRHIRVLKEKRKKSMISGVRYNDSLLVNKSLVFRFYIKRERTFSALAIKTEFK